MDQMFLLPPLLDECWWNIQNPTSIHPKVTARCVDIDVICVRSVDSSWCWTWCWTWCRTWWRTWCWTWCRCHCLSATGPIVTVRSVDAAGVWWELRSPQFSCAAAATVLLLALSDGSTVVLPTALLQAIVTLLPTVCYTPPPWPHIALLQVVHHRSEWSSLVLPPWSCDCSILSPLVVVLL